MHTTDPDLGPGQYTLITRNGECSRIWYVNPSDVVIPYITSTVKILTETQRTPEWFLMRKFRIAGTGTCRSVWKLLCARSVGLDENADAYEEDLSLEEDDKHHGIETSKSTNLSELRIICHGKERLPVSGMKQGDTHQKNIVIVSA